MAHFKRSFNATPSQSPSPSATPSHKPLDPSQPVPCLMAVVECHKDSSNPGHFNIFAGFHVESILHAEAIILKLKAILPNNGDTNDAQVGTEAVNKLWPSTASNKPN